MKLYAPDYYNSFKCIADRCRHSCCVGWEIDIDGETLEKYAALTSGYGVEIAKSIDKEETPHFRLAEHDRCLHLDERGLCRIITELGEGYLCHICREHPRFYNDTPLGKEVGLGMACEEAARLILSSDEYRNIVEIGEIECEADEIYFDALSHRSKIYSVLSDRSVSYIKRLKIISEEYGISLPDELRYTVNSLEYLDDSHRELFSAFSSDMETPAKLEKYLERALAYFIYRHCTQVCDESDFRASLGLCLFCERLVASITPLCENIFKAARIVSEEIEYSEDNTETIKCKFDF